MLSCNCKPLENDLAPRNPRFASCRFSCLSYHDKQVTEDTTFFNAPEETWPLGTWRSAPIEGHQKDAVVVSHNVKPLINLVPTLEVAGVISFLGSTLYQRAAGSRV
jgi:hypothetical protein